MSELKLKVYLVLTHLEGIAHTLYGRVDRHWLVTQRAVQLNSYLMQLTEGRAKPKGFS